MTVFWLSLALAVAGCAGLVLAGKGKWYGWAIGLAIQPVWAVFAVLTEAYGLIITAVMYGAVYGKNLLAWWRKEQDALRPKGKHAEPFPEIARARREARERQERIIVIPGQRVLDAMGRGRKEEDMGLTKHGHGEVLREQDDIEVQKTASMSDDDAAALAAENAEADK